MTRLVAMLTGINSKNIARAAEAVEQPGNSSSSSPYTATTTEQGRDSGKSSCISLDPQYSKLSFDGKKAVLTGQR